VKRKALLGTLFFAWIGSSTAAEPGLVALFPAGSKAGTKSEVRIEGKIDPWPCRFFCSQPGVTITPDPKKKGTILVSSKKDCVVGPIVIRAFNDEGTSEPAIFCIGGQSELLEDAQDHGTLAGAQLIQSENIPCVINGKLAKANEVDSYRIPLKKGQALYAAVDGYSLRSPIDPLLHLYDAKGARLLLAHDNAVNLDPLIVFQAPADGDYTLSIMAFDHPPTASVAFAGSSKSIYRIHLATSRKDLPARFFPAPLKPDSASATLTFPSQVDGTLLHPGEIDSFAITANKGANILVKVEAFRFRYPTDPVLFLRKKDGTLIKQIDDSKLNRDAAYVWKIPGDDTYRIQVIDRFGRGGEDFRYRLSVIPPEKDFSATIEKSSYRLAPGKSVPLKITLTRNDHTAGLSLRATGLPRGVTLEVPQSIPTKSGDFSVKLTASSECKNAAGAFRLLLKEKEGKTTREKPVVFSFQDGRSRGPFLIDDIPDIWLSVGKPAKNKSTGK